MGNLAIGGKEEHVIGQGDLGKKETRKEMGLNGLGLQANVSHVMVVGKLKVALNNEDGGDKPARKEGKCAGSNVDLTPHA